MKQCLERRSLAETDNRSICRDLRALTVTIAGRRPSNVRSMSHHVFVISTFAAPLFAPIGAETRGSFAVLLLLSISRRASVKRGRRSCLPENYGMLGRVVCLWKRGVSPQQTISSLWSSPSMAYQKRC